MNIIHSLFLSFLLFSSSFSPLFTSEKSIPSREINTELYDADLSYKQIWQILNTCIINEFTSSVVRHTYYRAYYTLYPHAGNLDPEYPPSLVAENQTAKIILFLHGTGGHPASFIPIAEALTENGIENLYSAFLYPSEEDPVSTSSIIERIRELNAIYSTQGYSNIEYALIGHSLGAIASAKLAFATPSIDESQISMIISLAGRLKYVPGYDFDWFCEAEKPTIEETFSAFMNSPQHSQLYTIIGSLDEIVPLESAHMSGNPENELTVEGWGHGGILFAPEAIDSIVKWTKDWVDPKIKTLADI